MKNSAANKLKQVPVGYLVIGIDVHKKKHAAVIMTQDFTTRNKFKFDNSREGFEMALERTRMEMVRTGSRGAIFAGLSRSDGQFSLNLFNNSIGTSDMASGAETDFDEVAPPRLEAERLI